MTGTRVTSSPCAEDTWPRKARHICLLDSVLLTMSGLLTRLDLRWWLLTVLRPGRRFCLCLSDHDAFHTFLWLYFLRAVSELYWFSPAILSILNSSPSFFLICCLSFFHPSPPLSLPICVHVCVCAYVRVCLWLKRTNGRKINKRTIQQKALGYSFKKRFAIKNCWLFIHSQVASKHWASPGA